MTESHRPIKLLHVFSTFAVGGPQVRFADIANALGAAYEHHIVSMDGRFDAAEMVKPPVSLHMHELPVEKNPLVSFRNFRVFRHFLRAQAPDLLLTYNWGAIEWALINQIGRSLPHIHFEDGFGPDESEGRPLRRRAIMRRFALLGADKIVIPSRVLERMALSHWGAPHDKLCYLPNGVDTQRFAPDKNDKMDFRKSDDEIVIGTVGALRKEKNFTRLIRAFAALGGDVKARLAIVGSGPEEDALRVAARERGVADRVTFAGHMERPECAYAGFDIFALSSDTEQMPYGVIEAMACGLPVVATDVGDIADMTPPEQRRFVISKEAEADYVVALSSLARDAGLRERLGGVNRTRAVDAYDKAVMLKRYDDLFKQTARI